MTKHVNYEHASADLLMVKKEEKKREPINSFLATNNKMMLLGDNY